MKGVSAALKLKHQIEEGGVEIGYSKGHTRSDDDEDQDSEESIKKGKTFLDDLNSRLCSLRSFVKKKNEGVVMSTPYLYNVISVNNNLIKRDHIKDLYDNHAVQGTYGDMTTCTTKVDPTIRSARDILDFQVKDECIRVLKGEWDKHMYPSCASVVPYKLHLYGPKDHFAPHKDTPETGLIGTIVLSIDHTNDFEGGELSFDNMKVSFRGWDSKCVMFFPDLVHEVKPVKKGYCARATFKVFASNPPQSKVSFDEAALSFAKNLFEGYETQDFGVLFGFQYSNDAQVLKGNDQRVYEILMHLFPQNSHLIPVKVNMNMEEEHAHVYDISDSALEKEESIFERTIVFGDMNEGVTWKDEHDPGAEHAGNSAREESRDSIYVHMAFIHYGFQ
jgi:mRNA-degrading endonuclease YafQ of YafQ-DinJ toxin-antitoxin module